MAREDKGRIRFILVDVESNNDTLQDALRTVANALSRPHPTKQAKGLPGGKTKQAPTNGDGESAEQEPTLFEMSEVIEGEEVEESETPRGDGSKIQKKFVTPKVLSDVELNSGETPFRAFVDQKQPKEQFDRYLVIATWFKQYRAIDTITPDHVYTCYRFMDGVWPVPKDFGQPFRDMKRKGWFDNGDKKNSWKINHIGEDKVARMANPA